MSIKKIGGRLINNTIPEIGLSMWGNLYDDPNKRWPDGTEVYTSRIIKIDHDKKQVETLNSIYTYEIGEGDE